MVCGLYTKTSRIGREGSFGPVVGGFSNIVGGFSNIVGGFSNIVGGFSNIVGGFSANGRNMYTKGLS